MTIPFFNYNFNLQPLFSCLSWFPYQISTFPLYTAIINSLNSYLRFDRCHGSIRQLPYKFPVQHINVRYAQTPVLLLRHMDNLRNNLKKLCT